ncbi:IS3 family transposase [Bacillus thuringiensis]|uniref:IS3 family transposase n=1 Tax=Bacillus thuringiensis TaxID=1428 RepID=UPI003458CA31
MGKKTHYPAEIKWKVVEMKHQGFKNKEIMDALGIKHVAQIKTWMKWYREGETYRFEQSIGRQSAHGKDLKRLTELEQKELEIRYLKAKINIAGKVPRNLKEVGGKEEIMKMIKEWQSIFTIAELCSIFNISRATYYRWKKQEKTVTNHEEKTVIEICQHHKYRYGYRRVTACLRAQFNIVMNHKKVLRIMRKYNVLSRVRKKKKIFVLGHEPVVAKNRIQRRFKATKPNEKWFTDITYLMFGNKTLYFSSIIDGFNNEIVSYKIGETQDVSLVLDTLKEALRKRNVIDTILHSDQGKVYTSKQFQTYAKEKGIITSMSRTGNCHDNALIESFHSHLKSEGFYAQNIKQSNNASIIQTVDEYIHYYNNERIQRKLANMSPIAYRKHVV